MKKRKVVMDAEGIERSLTRVAYQILEKNKGVEDLVLIGIQTGGILLAERLGKKISSIEGVPIPVGKLDITLYRDDIMKSGKQRISYDPGRWRIDAATSRFGCLTITVFLTPVPTLCYNPSNALLRAIRRD